MSRERNGHAAAFWAGVYATRQAAVTTVTKERFPFFCSLQLCCTAHDTAQKKKKKKKMKMKMKMKITSFGQHGPLHIHPTSMS